MIKNPEKYMQLALRLAKKGQGNVHPNPLVGAVLVKNNRIISRGAHLRFGGAHAEVTCLKNAGRRAKGASLFLNLEPCNHQGKTPPCAPTLKQFGIKEVY